MPLLVPILIRIICIQWSIMRVIYFILLSCVPIPTLPFLPAPQTDINRLFCTTRPNHILPTSFMRNQFTYWYTYNGRGYTEITFLWIDNHPWLCAITLKHFVLLILEVYLKYIWQALASRLNVLWFYLYTCWHCSQWRNCYLCDFHDGLCHLNDCWVSLLNGRSRGKWSCWRWKTLGSGIHVDVLLPLKLTQTWFHTK